MAKKKKLLGTAPGPIAAPGYAQEAPVVEQTGPEIIPDVYREFQGTDARSVMVVVHPHHWNFIPNPALRTGPTGWEVGGDIAPGDPDNYQFTMAATSNAGTNYNRLSAIGGADGDRIRADYVNDRPLLESDALAWYDAESVTATAALDASGNGQDLVFGAGANAPVVWPYSGVAYLGGMGVGTSTNYINIANAPVPLTAVISFDLALPVSAVTHYILKPATTGAANEVVITVANGNLTVDLRSPANASQPSTWNSVVTDTRTNYQITLTANSVGLRINGADAAPPTKTVATARSAAPSQGLYWCIATGSGGPSARLWNLTMDNTHSLNPVNYNATYTTIANSGTAGGNWTLTRPAVGLKIAVVDRAMMSFGGSHIAQIASATGDGPTAHSVLAVTRQYGTNDATIRHIWKSGTLTTNGSFLRQDASATTQKYAVYGGADNTKYSQGTTPALTDGQHIVGWSDPATGTARGYYDGTFANSITNSRTQFNPIWRPGEQRGLGATTSGPNVHVVSMAIFPRALSDAEMAQAAAQLVTPQAATPVQYWLVKDSTATLTPAQAPFPLSASVTGVRMWDASKDSLDADSWVGNSMLVSGDGTVRYRDGGYYVYVGPKEDIDGGYGEWYSVGRGSAAWRYSVWAKGKGEVRMAMDAYASSDPTKTMQPPQYFGLTKPGGTDGMWDYSAGAAVIGSGDTVWVRQDPPFYQTLGIVPVSLVDPTTLKPTSLLPSVVQSPDKHIWEVLPNATAVPYYADWGLPDEVADPSALTDGTRKYVRETGNQEVWTKIAGAAAQPYYRWTPTTTMADPAKAVPDTTQAPLMMMYGGALYKALSPFTAPYYANVGTPTPFDPDVVDPEEDPPGAAYLIDSDTGEVWQLLPKPYYTDLERGPAVGSVTSQWTRLDTDEWVRLWVRTGERMGTTATEPVRFPGAHWIDAKVEFRDADGLRLSAFLLDPNEFPHAAYFDGGMVEPAGVDDFLWEDPTKPDNSPSMYYYDRRNRFRWLYEHLSYVVPVSRPFQIFMNALNRPWIPANEVGATRSGRPRW